MDSSTKEKKNVSSNPKTILIWAINMSVSEEQEAIEKIRIAGDIPLIFYTSHFSRDLEKVRSGLGY